MIVSLVDWACFECSSLFMQAGKNRWSDIWVGRVRGTGHIWMLISWLFLSITLASGEAWYKFISLFIVRAAFLRGLTEIASFIGVLVWNFQNVLDVVFIWKTDLSGHFCRLFLHPSLALNAILRALIDISFNLRLDFIYLFLRRLPPCACKLLLTWCLPPERRAQSGNFRYKWFWFNTWFCFFWCNSGF